MATALAEQILDQVVAKLADITGGGGYEETVPAANIHRPPVGALEIEPSQCPALIVRLEADDTRFHLRGAQEHRLMVRILCVIDAALADSNEQLRDLLADVQKIAWTHRTWNSLARRTRVVDVVPHETEVVERTLSGSVLLEILARADRTNPYVAKTI